MSKEAVVIFKHNLEMHLKILEVKFYSLTQPKLYRFEEYRQTLTRFRNTSTCTKELLGRLEIKLLTGD